jgi:predicted secreted protein
MNVLSLKSLAAVAVLAAVTFAPASAALSLHTPVIVESDASGAVSVDAGEQFFIALQADAPAGYVWTAHVTDGKILAYEGNVTQPAQAGAPGQQIFVFHANRTGATTIVFDYARVYEPGRPPSRSLSFTIDVK